MSVKKLLIRHEICNVIIVSNSRLQAGPDEQGRGRQFARKPRDCRHTHHRPAQTQVCFMRYFTFSFFSSAFSPRISSCRTHSHAFADRFASAAIGETCAEVGIDVDTVAAPVQRAAPHQEGASRLRRHASKSPPAAARKQRLVLPKMTRCSSQLSQQSNSQAPRPFPRAASASSLTCSPTSAACALCLFAHFHG